MSKALRRLLRTAARLTWADPWKKPRKALQRKLSAAFNTAAVAKRPAKPRSALAQPKPSRALARQPALAPRSGARTAAGSATAAPAALRAMQKSFTSGTHAYAARRISYKLFVPPAQEGRRLPLVVMLHGCNQDPDDFAAGTGMNKWAQEHGFFVLYPAQSYSAHPQRCWNWYLPGHQSRGSGEPALLASLTCAVQKRYPIDPHRVFIAGLSAGGAMAAIVAEAYPDIFSAVGVHSGLRSGAASHMGQALAVMQYGASGLLSPSMTKRPVATIVFHGDQDKTVHPRNGEQVLHASLPTPHAFSPLLPANRFKLERGVSRQGRTYTRAVHRDALGAALAEHWVVHGAGHAWSGGHPAGSYTDAQGPDATGEMLRFFFEHTAGRAQRLSGA
ncbi:MAG: alpha/beta hydrolase family esterase [Burkholderiaceae bacterium]